MNVLNSLSYQLLFFLCFFLLTMVKLLLLKNVLGFFVSCWMVEHDLLLGNQEL